MQSAFIHVHRGAWPLHVFWLGHFSTARDVFCKIFSIQGSMVVQNAQGISGWLSLNYLNNTV